MNIVFCANHSYPHCGGSEQVLKEVSECLVKLFNHKITVVSDSILGTQEHNGVLYEPASRMFVSNDIKPLVALKPDHVFVYSDSFKYFRTLLSQSHQLKCKKSIALLGMYYMSNKQSILHFFRSLVDLGEWTPIVHDEDGSEGVAARTHSLCPTVIPNGVNLDEFKKQPDYFRNKHDIKTKYTLLCVANFFPGKGQEHLVNTLRILQTKRDDFTIVFVATPTNISTINDSMKKFPRLIRTVGCEYKLLWDIPRQDVVQSYFESDLFVFPSQKEVAPLVILEAMASGLPWVSHDVGNVPSLAGGSVLKFEKHDPRGFGIYDHKTHDYFATEIHGLLCSDNIRKELGASGRKDVEEKYNWDSIIHKYNDVFTKQ